MKNILNKKGSALILVLSSLIILMAISSVVVMLSAANIKLSRKYSDWSREYYWLDYAAQEKLSEIDKSVLIPAENIARFYLQNGYFQFTDTGEFPASGTPGELVVALSLAPGLQTLLNGRWAEIEAIIGDVEVPDEADQLAYDSAMNAFIPQAFDAIYNACVSSALPAGPVVTIPSEVPDVTVETTLLNAGWFPNAAAYTSFSDFYSVIDGVSPRVQINAVEDRVEQGKKVEVNVTIVPPGYNAVQQTRSFAVKPNPLYANAVSVQGSISFTGSGDVNIYGDVAACSRTLTGNPLGLEEGNAYGIKTQTGSSVDVTIYGNVYSGGDLHLFGNGSSVFVEPYLSPDGRTLKTDLLYSAGNSYYFDLSAAPGAAAYAEDNFGGLGDIPYIYLDSTGGNVYCNSLAIESGVQYGTLDISGNVWTRDDIQNDGQAGTSITVGENYIGMRSDANEANKDPNGSSAIINNAYFFDGVIEVGGSYVIPGTSWYVFTGSGTEYYQTAESISAQAGEFFQIYLIREDETGSITETYYVTAEEYYELFERENGSSLSQALSDRIERFEDAIAALPDLDSNVDVETDHSYYMLGAAVNDEGDLISPNTGTGNFLDYRDVSAGILPSVFDAKTRYFGTNGEAFTSLIDDTVGRDDSANRFYYYQTNATVDISSLQDGILYCGGNLTLTGSGSFSGSVICAGNLTISSGINLVYDESVVKTVMGIDSNGDFNSNLGSRVARRFFSPGEYNAASVWTIENYTVISANAGERISGEITRYIVDSWKEMNKTA